MALVAMLVEVVQVVLSTQRHSLPQAVKHSRFLWVLAVLVHLPVRRLILELRVAIPSLALSLLMVVVVVAVVLVAQEAVAQALELVVRVPLDKAIAEVEVAAVGLLALSPLTLVVVVVVPAVQLPRQLATWWLLVVMVALVSLILACSSRQEVVVDVQAPPPRLVLLVATPPVPAPLVPLQQAMPWQTRAPAVVELDSSQPATELAVRVALVSPLCAGAIWWVRLPPGTRPRARWAPSAPICLERL